MQTKWGSHARTRTLAKVQRNVLFHHMTPDRFRVVTKHQIPPLISPPKQMPLTFPPHYYNAATLLGASVYPCRGQRMWQEGLGATTSPALIAAHSPPTFQLLSWESYLSLHINKTSTDDQTSRADDPRKILSGGTRTSQELLNYSIGKLRHGNSLKVDYFTLHNRFVGTPNFFQGCVKKWPIPIKGAELL